MEDREKSQEELVEEIGILKRRLTELENSEFERKRAEGALVKERNLLRTLIDNLPVYVFIKDTDSRYIVSNKAHARFLGKARPEEVIGKTVFELFPGELAAQYAADDQKIIQTGQALLNREERSIDQKGKKQWNLATKVPLQDREGKIVGLVGIARDITESKQAEEQRRILKENQEETNRIMTGCALKIVDWKKEVNKLGKEFGKLVPYDVPFSE